MTAIPPDEQEPLFTPDGYAEVRITVRIPGSISESGEPEVFGYSQLLTPEEVRIQEPRKFLPSVIERAAKSVMLSMRWR